MQNTPTPARIADIPPSDLDTLGVAFDPLQRNPMGESDFAARVQKSLSQADKGDFVPSKQITAFFAKYGC